MPQTTQNAWIFGEGDQRWSSSIGVAIGASATGGFRFAKCRKAMQLKRAHLVVGPTAITDPNHTCLVEIVKNPSAGLVTGGTVMASKTLLVGDITAHQHVDLTLSATAANLLLAADDAVCARFTTDGSGAVPLGTAVEIHVVPQDAAS